jgi:hypothetical protein
MHSLELVVKNGSGDQRGNVCRILGERYEVVHEFRDVQGWGWDEPCVSRSVSSGANQHLLRSVTARTFVIPSCAGQERLMEAADKVLRNSPASPDKVGTLFQRLRVSDNLEIIQGGSCISRRSGGFVPEDLGDNGVGAFDSGTLKRLPGG